MFQMWEAHSERLARTIDNREGEGGSLETKKIARMMFCSVA